MLRRHLIQGSGYIFDGKMPGCYRPSLAAATGLHFTAGYLRLSLQQEPTPCFAFLGGNSPLPIRSTGAIILPGSQKHVRALIGALATGGRATGLYGKKKHPDPSFNLKYWINQACH